MTARRPSLVVFCFLICAGNVNCKRTVPELSPSSSAPGASSAAPILGRCNSKLPSGFERASAKGASSPVDLLRVKTRLFAVIADRWALHVVDAETMQEVSVTPLEGNPGNVLVLSDGRIAVSLQDKASVALYAASEDLSQPLRQVCSQTVAADPWALAETGEKLLVTSRSGAMLTVLDRANLDSERAIPLPQDPRAVLVANAGTTAFVSHAVGGIVSVVDLVNAGSVPTSIALPAGRRVKPGLDGFDEKTPRAANYEYSLAQVDGTRKDGSRDLLRILVPHVSVDPGAPTPITTESRWASGTSPRPLAQTAIVIDPAEKKAISSHVPGMYNGRFTQDCLLPRSAVADDNGLFVACLDLNAVVEYDPWVGDPSLAERRRFTLPAGPTGLALQTDGKRLFVWSQFDRSLSRIERESGSVSSLPLWQREQDSSDPKVEIGRRLFYTSLDARLSSGRTCENCHIEGRSDGFDWTGLGKAITTKPLIAHLAAVDAKTLKDYMPRHFRSLGGTGLSKSVDELDALIAFLKSSPAQPKEVRPAVGSPPPGWELSPALAAPPTEKPKGKSADCCRFDASCCTNQGFINEAKCPVVSKVVEVRISDLPYATIKEQAEGGAPVLGSPVLRALDQGGRPFPWDSSPSQIRLVPPGQFGEIAWNSEWFTQFYAEKKYQGYGYGEVHLLPAKSSDNGRNALKGNVEYVAIDKGADNKLLLDIVKGIIDGSPEVKASSWTHVEAVHLSNGVVYGYRSKQKEGSNDSEMVHFLLPSVSVGFESKATKHRGAASDQSSYSLYTMPVGPGQSNLAKVRFDTWHTRGFKDATGLIDPMPALFALSQTSVEAAPRIRIIFLADKPCRP